MELTKNIALTKTELNCLLDNIKEFDYELDHKVDDDLNDVYSFNDEHAFIDAGDFYLLVDVSIKRLGYTERATYDTPSSEEIISFDVEVGRITVIHNNNDEDYKLTGEQYEALESKIKQIIKYVHGN